MTSESYRKNAISAGILFIVADLVAFLSFPFLASVNANDYLSSISENGSLVATGALLLFIGGAAAIGIAVSLYPVLKRHNEILALGAVGFRVVEGVFYFAGVTCLLLLKTLSQQFVAAGSPGPSQFQTLGALVLSGFDWVNVVSLMAFSIGCLLYYYLFYRTKLIPRWLSGWGIASSLLTMTSGLLVMFEVFGPNSVEQGLLNMSILPQELVLAVWLIFKGFATPASSASTAGPDHFPVTSAQPR